MSAPRLSPRDAPRLHAQILRLQKFFLAHPRAYFSLAELCHGIGAISEAGLSARLREMTGEPYHWAKDKRKRGRNLWEYKLTPPGIAAQLEIL